MTCPATGKLLLLRQQLLTSVGQGVIAPMSVERMRMDALARYALRLGDDALILSLRLQEWSGRTPTLEDDLALTHLALDLLGQARSLLTYAAEREGAGRSEDDLAYRRSPAQFTHCRLVELPTDQLTVVVARQLLFSSWQYELFDALQASSEPRLAALAAGSVKQVAQHRDSATLWVLQYGHDAAAAGRLGSALADFWPYVGELAGVDRAVGRLSARGLVPDPGGLLPAWSRYVRGVLAEATIPVPAGDPKPVGRRRRRASSELAELLRRLRAAPRPGQTGA